MTALGAIVTIVAGSAVLMPAAQATGGGEPAALVHKSYVCKYVSKPGASERLQTGQNPIWVDNHSLLGDDGTVSVGQSFSDAQGRSVVIVANTPKLDPEPGIDQCPAPTSVPKAVITYGSWTGAPTCENPSIYQTRVVFTAVYSWKNGAWVLGAPVKTGSQTATEPMALTDAEYFTSCAPATPTKDPLVVPGEYGGAAPTCATPSVEWTRTLTTTSYSYVWNTDKARWDEKVTTTQKTDTATETHSLTAAQVNACRPKLPPTVKSGSQTCTVGNQGQPSLTGGQIVLGTSAGVSTKVLKDGAEVSPLTGLLPGTYTIVASLTDASHSSWGTLPAGWTLNDGKVSYSVTISAADLTSCTEGQPKAVITYGNWTGTPTCENPSIYQTRDVFTAVYSWKDGAWVLGAPVKTGSQTATEPMALTDAEYFTSCAPATPTKDPLVVPGEYGGAAPTCATPSVEWTRTLTTTSYSYVWNAETRVWDMVTSTPVVTTDRETKPMVLGADEVKACAINLSLTKSVTSTGPYFGGSNVTYSLVPHNGGPGVVMAGWSVTEVLPEGSILVGLSGDGYDCLLTNLVCTSRDALAAGAYGKAITAKVEIPEGMTGSFKNVAYVSPSPGEITETNPLVVPTISTDTASTPTDNDAEGVVTVLPPKEEGITITLPDTGVVTVSPPQVKGITITLPNTGATISLTWFLGAIGLLAAGVILVGASRVGARSRKS